MTERYLYKGVHSHDSHVWLTLGIVHQVQIDKLFQFQVVRLHAVHDVGEQSTAPGTENYVTTVSKPKVIYYSAVWQQFPPVHLTSLPTVIDAMTFFTASFFFSFLSLFSSALSSNISPVQKRHTYQRATHRVPYFVCVCVCVCKLCFVWYQNITSKELSTTTEQLAPSITTLVCGINIICKKDGDHCFVLRLCLTLA